MLRIHKFAALPRARQLLLLRTFSTVAAIRLMTCVFPFRLWRTRFPVRPAVLPARPAWAPADIVWAVLTASVYVPGATCLVRALAAQFLFARAGHGSRLHIGVASAKAGLNRSLDSHAWVECEGQVLLGGPDTSRYRSLLMLDGSA